MASVARARLCTGLILSAWALGSPARAETTEDPARQEARALAYAGVEAFAVADYRTANGKLEAAFRLLPVPSLGLWSARTLAALGQLVEAEQRYRAVIALVVAPTDPPVQGKAKADAEVELQELLPRIPSLMFQFSGATPARANVEVDELTVDTAKIQQPHRVNPGRHVVIGHYGLERTVVVVDLVEGQHEEVWFRFAEPAAVVEMAPETARVHEQPRTNDEAETLLTAGWISVAFGGASIATGVAAYLIGRGEHADVVALGSCSEASCSAAATDAYRTYQTWRTVQLVGLLAGGLSTAAGVTLLVAGNGGSDAGKQKTSAQLGLRIGPGAAALVGRF